MTFVNSRSSKAVLTSQLESQRVYFEELVNKVLTKASAASTAATTATQRAADEANSTLGELEKENGELKEVVKGLERDLEKEKKRGERSVEVARDFRRSLMEEKRVGEGLMEHIGFLNSHVEKIIGELEKVKLENVELKEENRDLLFSISA
jgi:BRCA1-associated protein